MVSPDWQCMEYALYKAYQNHSLHCLAINYISSGPYECLPPTMPENLQPMDPKLDPIQSIPNLQLNNPNGSQGQRLSPKQLRFDLIPMSYIELLPILIQSKLIILTPIEPLKPSYPRWYDKKLVVNST